MCIVWAYRFTAAFLYEIEFSQYIATKQCWNMVYSDIAASSLDNLKKKNWKHDLILHKWNIGIWLQWQVSCLALLQIVGVILKIKQSGQSGMYFQTERNMLESWYDDVLVLYLIIALHF